jgi:hypothetical protein
VLCSHLAAVRLGVPPWRTGSGSPGRAHKERPRCRTATGMKKCVAFPGGALTDFGFQKRGAGWVRVPAHLRALLCAQGQDEGAIVFFYLRSFAMRWTAVPMPTPQKNKQPSNGGLSHRARDSGPPGDTWLRKTNVWRRVTSPTPGFPRLTAVKTGLTSMRPAGTAPLGPGLALR